MSTIILFLFVLIISFILTFAVKFFAQKKSLLDIPNERSSHTIPTPRGGGLAIAITWFAVISYLFYKNEIEAHLFYALLSGVMLCIISFIDDIYNLPSLPRIITHAFVAGFALYEVGGIGNVDLGFYVISDSLFLNVFAFLGIIWFINLFNFIDGIDGYTASETIFVALSFYIFTGESYVLLLAMAVLGFLILNWQRAKIFMGDIGSTLLGFTLIVLAIYYNNTEKLPIFNSLMLTALFWFDATYTLFRRFLNKENIGQPHKKHAYQRIVQYGFSHQKTVIYGMFINVLLFCITFLSIQHYSSISLYFCAVIIFLWLIIKNINTKKSFI